MRMGSIATPAVLGIMAVIAAEARANAAPAGTSQFTGEMELVLWRSLFHAPTPSENPANLVLELACDDGQWQRLWGYSLGYCKNMHEGLVEEGTVGPDTIRLKLNVIVNGDQWNRVTCRGAFSVELKRDGDGKLQGTYQGTFKGQKISGKASGAIKPPRPIVVKDFRPVQDGEHPRVLLRKHELAALREKLATPFGQAYKAAAIKAMEGREGDAINAGLLYALTGEQKFADRARDTVSPWIADADSQFINTAGSGSSGHKLVATALALDLCHDAWTPEFRAKVDAGLMEVVPKMCVYCMVTSHANPHPCSNYFGPGHGPPAIASLVLMDYKGTILPKPVNPVGTASIVLPAEDFKPAEGVPVVDLTPGQTPAKWLCAGPIPRKSRNDVLGSIGGYARARPRIGTEARTGVMVDDKIELTSVTFKPLADDMLKDGAINLEKIAAAPGPSTTLYYTVLKVDKVITVALGKNSADTRVWLSETELSGDYYRLRPGLYPMMVVHATEKSTGVLTPRLEASDSGAGAEGMALYALEMAMWERNKALCQKGGGLDGTKLQVLDLGYQRVYQHLHLGIGDGGFQAETGVYALIASWFPVNYAAFHRRVFGRDASPYPDATHLMVRRMMQVVFPPGGKPLFQKINSVAGFDPRYTAAAFPLIPEQYKPAILWAWNEVCGVSGPENAGKILDRDGGLGLALSFINYPLDMKPAHPSKVMPLAWEAPTFGFHVFRSGWEGKDEFVGQAFLKASFVGGWNHPNAGTFRMLGLGHEWVVGSVERVGFRDHEPCVRMPEDSINNFACGKLAYLKTQPDGSANLTIDLNDVYSSSDGRLYDGNLLRNDGLFVSSGITGLRALAFDYSGKCGAPALLAVVDKIAGGKSRVWQWTVPPGTIGKVKADDRGFTLDYGDASMRLTFVTPSPVKLHVGADNAALGKLGDGHRSFEGVIERVTATGNADFFIVATFQRGPAPQVQVEGEGLKAKVIVGGRRVSFDGTKVLTE